MGDSFGVLEFPVPLAGPGEAAGDPALTRLAHFLRAYLNANAGAAWNQIAPTTPLVRGVHFFDPTEGPFTENDLPALYAWRSGDPRGEYVGEDILVNVSEISLLWVTRPAQLAHIGRRYSFTNPVWKAVRMAIEEGRTPGYVVPGDTDPSASTRGSLIWPLIGAWRVDAVRSRRRPIQDRERDPDTTEPHRYLALEMTIELHEDQRFDLELRSEPIGDDNRAEALDANGDPLVTVRY